MWFIFILSRFQFICRTLFNLNVLYGLVKVVFIFSNIT